MAARRICSLADLTEQTYGIPEPGAHCPEIPPEQIDLCIVPSLACDRAGYRLGYGGGFYDRFLAAEPEHPTAALCYDFQMLPHLDTDPFDIPVDLVLYV